jgi:hypothetical protein
MPSMKKLTFTLLLSLATAWLHAQMLNPVTWTFTAKKTAEKVYEVRLIANIQNGWHLYSQNQPADAINIPTEIKFNPNPFLIPEGKTKEIGNMELFKDKKLGISANQYKEKVVFVQKVKMKSNIRTNVVGSVEFQTCDDKKCLPPKKLDFSIALK